MKPTLRYALFLLLFCITVRAQEISPALFGGLQWRLIGPFRGGRAVAVTGVGGGSATFFFGSVDGGIWKTTDAGTVWTPIFDGQQVASIGALAVAPSNANVIYAGTGESDIRSDLASGDGVYKTNDAGKTWKNVGLHDTRQISRILVDPQDARIVFVAALGHAYGPNEERGVFRSSDGGETWRRVLDGGTKTGAADLAMAADEPRILFAAMWEAHRPPWSTYAPVEGENSGLFRSMDGGETWTKLTGHGLPTGKWGRTGIAIAGRTHGRTIYATIDAHDGGLYRSDDGGDTWALVNKDPRIVSRAWYFNSITADPQDPDVLYVPNVALYKLSEGGKKLSIVRGAPGGDDYHQLWIDPTEPEHMVLGTDQGTTVSLNGGETWSTWYNQPTAQLYHVVTDKEFPYHVYGAQQDSGTAAMASRTDHNQIDARDFFNVGGSESGYIAPDPRDPNIFYVSGTYGSVERVNRRTMQIQNIAPSPMGAFGTEILERRYRAPWTPVLVFSPVQTNALYLGTQYLLRTTDGGLHWRAISSDLTGASKAKPASGQGPLTVDNAKERGYGVIYTIAPSPLQANEIWVGSDTGLIHLTRDGGLTWSDVTPRDVSSWSKITQLEASHFASGVAYAAVDRHRLDDMRPYLYRTRDSGKSWKLITDGIADHSFLNCIREDPKRKGLLYAGTEFGVYISFNDGEHWLPLQLNLPVTSVRDLQVHGDDLVVATHGRSVWILDNISALRQIDEHTASADMWLYKPARALRTANQSFLGTPLPPEEPQAKNPPRGAFIDYYLRDGLSGELQLDILDLHGKTIRHYSSNEGARKIPERVPIAPRWFAQPASLSTQPGMHRFVWDLRYGRTGKSEDGDDDSGGEARWLGPFVQPGVYTVRLSVEGRSFKQPLEIAMDPRLRISNAELAQQFEWAQRAFDDMIETLKVSGEIRTLQTQLEEQNARVSAGSQPLRDAIGEARRRSREILDGGAKGREAGLQFASRGLSAALNAMESADRAIPAQVLELYRQCSRVSKTQIAGWRRFETEMLPNLNRELQGAGLKPVEISRLELEAEESIAK